MSLDVKRKELELIKVGAAKAELEFKILERMEDIERIKVHIDVQIKKEEDLKAEIEKLTLKGE